MLSATEVRIFNQIKNSWSQFKSERNMPKYQGVESPNWITMLKREDYLETLLRYCEKLIKDDR